MTPPPGNIRRSDAICMVGHWTGSRGACREYRLARSLGLPVYHHAFDEIRPLALDSLLLYDSLVAGGTYAAD